MSVDRFEIRASSATRDNFQAAIEKALQGSIGAPVMRWTWRHGTCVAHAPGCDGSIRLENGKIVAMIRLSFFAFPLKELIHHDIIRVLKTLGEGHVSRVVG
jgi:hypothetical protein